MKKTGILIIALALIVVICGAFYAVNEKSKKENQKETVLTEIQKVTTKDLDRDYPQTPREVIKFYNKKNAYKSKHFLYLFPKIFPVCSSLFSFFFSLTMFQECLHF